MERVKEIYKLSLKHNFQIGRAALTEEDLAKKRALAEQYRNDPVLFARVRDEAVRKLAKFR
jgi:hypothetical protein